MYVSFLLTGTQLFCLASLFALINFQRASGSSNFIKIVETALSTISKYFPTPIWPLISLSCMSMLTVNVTLDSIFNVSNLAKPLFQTVYDFMLLLSDVVRIRYEH